MKNEPVIPGHEPDCRCYECVSQRKFDNRVRAHWNDKKTKQATGCVALIGSTLFSAFPFAIFWWLMESRSAVIWGAAVFATSFAFLYVFVFYSMVLNAPYHSSYRMPGSMPIGEGDRSGRLPGSMVASETRESAYKQFVKCPRCKARSEGWDWDTQSCRCCGHTSAVPTKD